MLLTATLTLRPDVTLCCKPYGAEDGSEIPLGLESATRFTFQELCNLLSSLQWDSQSVGSVGPPLDSDGRIAVQKVYYALDETQGPAPDSGNNSKRSGFNGVRSFAEFAEWYSQVPANAVVSLKLWHETTGSAPSTPPRALAQKAQGVFRLLCANVDSSATAARWFALLCTLNDGVPQQRSVVFILICRAYTRGAGQGLTAVGGCQSSSHKVQGHRRGGVRHCDTRWADFHCSLRG